MTPLHLLIPTYRQMLEALSAWLETAGDDDRVLSAKLAPDMFPLTTQVRFACLQSIEGAAHLRGEDVPPIWRELLEEGRNGDAAPGSLADARRRISETLAHLEATAAAPPELAPGRAVEIKLPDGRVFDMTIEEYVRDWAIPQFYFHVMTAYALLRRDGVALGKADYVAHAFAYLRPTDGA